MNEGYQLYLGTYSRIESIDRLVKSCRMKYRCWNYWHSPMLHDMSLAVVSSYKIYLGVSEGDVDQTSKDNNIIDLWKFRYLLSNQMIKYNPKY